MLQIGRISWGSSPEPESNKHTKMKLIKLLNQHSKALKSEVPLRYPKAREINIAAYSGGVTRSANNKQQTTKFFIEIEIIEEVNNGN